MDGLTRFTLSWSLLLAVVAVLVFLTRSKPMPAVTLETTVEMSARVRWWGTPVLYASGLVFCLRLERASEVLDELVNQHGWKITVRRV